MAAVSTNIKIDAGLKKESQELFESLGMSLSTAVNIFLRQAVREQAIPFRIEAHTPNAETIQAMEEAEEMSRNPGNYKRYGTFSELVQEVQNDA